MTESHDNSPMGPQYTKLVSFNAQGDFNTAAQTLLPSHSDAQIIAVQEHGIRPATQSKMIPSAPPKAGISTYLSKDFQEKCIMVHKPAPESRAHITEITLLQAEVEKLVVVNVHADPERATQKHFYSALKALLTPYHRQNTPLIILMDANNVLDPLLDEHSSIPNHTRQKENHLKNLCTELNLHSSIRLLRPIEPNLWSRETISKNGITRRLIDVALVSDNIRDRVVDAGIDDFTHSSDHRPVYVSLDLGMRNGPTAEPHSRPQPPTWNSKTATAEQWEEFRNIITGKIQDRPYAPISNQSEITEAEAFLQDCIISAADEALGRKTRQEKNSPGREPKKSKQIAKLNALGRKIDKVLPLLENPRSNSSQTAKALRNINDRIATIGRCIEPLKATAWPSYTSRERRELLRKCRNKTRKEARKIQKAATRADIKSKVDRILEDIAKDHNNVFRLFRTRNEVQPLAVEGIGPHNGKLFSSPTEILDRLPDFWEDLQTNFKSKERFRNHAAVRCINKIDRNSAPSAYDKLGTFITQEEVSEVIKNKPADKSPGLSGITYSLLKHLPNPATELLTQITNAAFFLGIMPDQWRKSRVSLLYKNEGSSSNMKSYRPITLLECEYKIYSTILNRRLQSAMERWKLVPETQQGFRKNRHTLSAVQTFTKLINDRNANKTPLYATFCDFFKAFDTISHQVIEYVLREMQYPEVLVKAVVSTLHGSKAKFITPFGYTREIDINRGVKQGDITSPTLFILVFAPFLFQLQEAHVRAASNLSPDSVESALDINNLAFADDLALLAEREEDMKLAFDMLIDYTDAFDVQINPKKSGQAWNTHAQKPATLSAPNVDGVEEPVLQLGPSTPYKYLGIMIRLDGNQEDEIKRVISLHTALLKAVQPRRYLDIPTQIRVINAIGEAIVLFHANNILLPRNTLRDLDSNAITVLARNAGIPSQKGAKSGQNNLWFLRGLHSLEASAPLQHLAANLNSINNPHTIAHQSVQPQISKTETNQIIRPQHTDLDVALTAIEKTRKAGKNTLLQVIASNFDLHLIDTSTKIKNHHAFRNPDESTPQKPRITTPVNLHPKYGFLVFTDGSMISEEESGKTIQLSCGVHFPQCPEHDLSFTASGKPSSTCAEAFAAECGIKLAPSGSKVTVVLDNKAVSQSGTNWPRMTWAKQAKLEQRANYERIELEKAEGMKTVDYLWVHSHLHPSDNSLNYQTKKERTELMEDLYRQDWDMLCEGNRIADRLADQSKEKPLKTHPNTPGLMRYALYDREGNILTGGLPKQLRARSDAALVRHLGNQTGASFKVFAESSIDRQNTLQPITARDTASNRANFLHKLVTNSLPSPHKIANKKVGTISRACKTPERPQRVHYCKLCTHVELGHSRITRHSKQFHQSDYITDSDSDKEIPYDCNHCSFTSLSHAKMRKHMVKKHPELPQIASVGAIEKLVPVPSELLASSDSEASVTPSEVESQPPTYPSDSSGSESYSSAANSPPETDEESALFRKRREPNQDSRMRSQKKRKTHIISIMASVERTLDRNYQGLNPDIDDSFGALGHLRQPPKKSNIDSTKHKKKQNAKTSKYFTAIGDLKIYKYDTDLCTHPDCRKANQVASTWHILTACPLGTHIRDKTERDMLGLLNAARSKTKNYNTSQHSYPIGAFNWWFTTNDKHSNENFGPSYGKSWNTADFGHRFIPKKLKAFFETDFFFCLEPSEADNLISDLATTLRHSYHAIWKEHCTRAKKAYRQKIEKFKKLNRKPKSKVIKDFFKKKKRPIAAPKPPLRTMTTVPKRPSLLQPKRRPKPPPAHKPKNSSKQRTITSFAKFTSHSTRDHNPKPDGPPT